MLNSELKGTRQCTQTISHQLGNRSVAAGCTSTSLLPVSAGRGVFRQEQAEAVQGRGSLGGLGHPSMAPHMGHEPSALLWQLPQLGPGCCSCLYAAQEPPGSMYSALVCWEGAVLLIVSFATLDFRPLCLIQFCLV